MPAWGLLDVLLRPALVMVLITMLHDRRRAAERGAARITARHLRELIDALDRRVRRPGADREAGIARESALLRRQAVAQLDTLVAAGAVPVAIRRKPSP